MKVLYKPSVFKVAAFLCLLAAFLAVAGYLVLLRDARSTSHVSAVTSNAPVQTSDHVAYVAQAGVSVLDQLKSVADVETKQSTYGTLVESINGVKNGTDGKYWLFYVDGKMPDKGADAYVSKGGEKIEWKFLK